MIGTTVMKESNKKNINLFLANVQFDFISNLYFINCYKLLEIIEIKGKLGMNKLTANFSN